MLKKNLRLIIISILLCILTLSTFCFAENTTPNNVVAEETEDSTLLIATNSSTVHIKQGDQYLVGTSINIDYDVEGNTYILAETVTIDAKIKGNAFIAANKINITENGYVDSSLYAAANEINVNGTIYDMYTVSDTLNFTGFAHRDIHSAAKTINISGSVGRDASITFKNVNFSGKATIFGNLDYTAEEEISIPNGLVEGNVHFTKSENVNINFTFKVNYVFLAVSFVVLILGLWLVFKWLAPKFLENTSKLVADGPFKTFGFGLLGFICIPVISILLLVAQVTAVLGLLLIGIYLIFACISTSVFVISINNLISQKLKINKAIAIFGLLIITSIIAWALTLIPFVGGVFGIVYTATGFGIIIRNLIPKKDKTVTE